MSRHLVIAGGGTGGHIVPALALADAARRRGDTVRLITGARAVEARVLATSDLPRFELDVRGFATVGWLQRARALLGLIPATSRVALHLLRHRPSYVVLTGGYVALPVGIAAVLLAIPVVLVEPNAVPGRTTRILARVARAAIHIRQSGPLAARCRMIEGVPVRSAIVELGSQRVATDMPEQGSLVVLGGSQGAASLNRVAPRALPEGLGMPVVHIAGPGRRGEVGELYAERRIEARVEDYVDDMAGLYSEAALVVARAGAGTVAELMAARIPAVLVPYPHAADDHQRLNAELFVAAGGGAMVLEGEDFEARLRRAVEQVLEPGQWRAHRQMLAGGDRCFDAERLLASVEEVLSA